MFQYSELKEDGCWFLKANTQLDFKIKGFVTIWTRIGQENVGSLKKWEMTYFDAYFEGKCWVGWVDRKMDRSRME